MAKRGLGLLLSAPWLEVRVIKAVCWWKLSVGVDWKKNGPAIGYPHGAVFYFFFSLVR